MRYGKFSFFWLYALCTAWFAVLSIIVMIHRELTGDIGSWIISLLLFSLAALFFAKAIDRYKKYDDNHKEER